MKPDEFVKEPWVKGAIHPAYEASFLHMRPAPEYASGEVVLASTMRSVGFPGVSEGKVPASGRKFQKALKSGKKPRSGKTGTGIDTDAWNRIVTGTIRSPKQPNQSTKRFLQISPVVPDAALYSLSARQSANSWNPGELVKHIVRFGKPSEPDALEIWCDLFHALSVGDDDDIWARFLQEEFTSWRGDAVGVAWSVPQELKLRNFGDTAKAWHLSGTQTPAGQFVEDLPKILQLKNHLTRRQWTTMLETLLRLGTASHVLWVCKANHICFQLMWKAVSSGETPTVEDLRRDLGMESGFWRYGQPAGRAIEKYAADFIKARAGINLLLHQAQDTLEVDGLNGSLRNLETFASFLDCLAKGREGFGHKKFLTRHQEVLGKDPRLTAGKKGIPNNVKEFLRHVLGKRQTAEPGLESYDQGYFLAKRGSHKAAPWHVSLGPVAVLAVVHACTAGTSGPRTVEDFCRHLAAYGIMIEVQDVPTSPLGKTLRNLGLVLDSPDAEGGMVVVNPFTLVAKEAAGE